MDLSYHHQLCMFRDPASSSPVPQPQTRRKSGFSGVLIRNREKDECFQGFRDVIFPPDARRGPAEKSDFRRFNTFRYSSLFTGERFHQEDGPPTSFHSFLYPPVRSSCPFLPVPCRVFARTASRRFPLQYKASDESRRVFALFARGPCIQ